jgi:hypothetical protein
MGGAGKRRRAPAQEEMIPMPEPVGDPGSDRAALSLWWQQRMDQMIEEHKERVKQLRHAGEHPSPVFARQVRMFGSLGIMRLMVANLLGITVAEMDKYYGDEYELGQTEVIASVASNMIRIATSTTDPNAAKVGMDLLARRGGNEWKPPAQKVKLEDDRERAPNTIDSSKLTFKQRQELRAMIEHVTSGEPGEPVQPGESDMVES